jgi:hypothetical protein
MFILATVLNTGSDNLSKLFAKKLAIWLEIFWSITITVQVSASTLIAYKIYETQNKMASSGTQSLVSTKSVTNVMRIIIDSGAIMSLSTIVLLAFYVAHAFAGAVVAAICGQLTVSISYIHIVKYYLI